MSRPAHRSNVLWFNVAALRKAGVTPPTSGYTLSVAHGEAMSPQLQEGFYDAVSTYVRTRDPDSFADDLENAVSNDRIPQR